MRTAKYVFPGLYISLLTLAVACRTEDIPGNLKEWIKISSLNNFRDLHVPPFLPEQQSKNKR